MELDLFDWSALDLVTDSIILFAWTAWDLVTDSIMQFYGCKLKVSIGRFVAGETVPIILVDFEKGVLQLFDKGRAVLLSEHKVRMVLAD